MIRLGRYQTAVGALGSSLRQAGEAGSVDATATEVDAGLLTLHDARLHKRGDRLTASATVRKPTCSRAADPRSVSAVGSAGGQLTLRGTASLFGVTATIQAIVHADGGALLVTPHLPFGGLATISVFSNPHVAVESVAGSPVTGGFSVRGTALVH